MGRNGHGPKWLWAEMVMGRNGYGPKRPGILFMITLPWTGPKNGCRTNTSKMINKITVFDILPSFPTCNC